MRSAKAGILWNKMGFTGAILATARKQSPILNGYVAKARHILFLPRPGFGGWNLIQSSRSISAKAQRCSRRLPNSKSTRWPLEQDNNVSRFRNSEIPRLRFAPLGMTTAIKPRRQLGLFDATMIVMGG